MDYYALATAARCDAAQRGVSMRVAVTAETESDGAFSRLRSCGVIIHLYHGQRHYIHAKILVVDARKALVGSQNLSTGPRQCNRELGIMLSDPAVAGQLAGEFASAVSGAV